MIYKRSEIRQEWTRLVRSKLVPLKLLIPVGQGTHEWSRTYRDMIFEMATFMACYRSEVTSELVRKFVGQPPKNDIVASFSASEIEQLMRKSVEYNLPVHRFSPLSAGARCPVLTLEAPLSL